MWANLISLQRSVAKGSATPKWLSKPWLFSPFFPSLSYLLLLFIIYFVLISLMRERSSPSDPRVAHLLTPRPLHLADHVAPQVLSPFFLNLYLYIGTDPHINDLGRVTVRHYTSSASTTIDRLADSPGPRTSSFSPSPPSPKHILFYFTLFFMYVLINSV